jgi:hypothetical protein
MEVSLGFLRTRWGLRRIASSLAWILEGHVSHLAALSVLVVGERDGGLTGWKMQTHPRTTQYCIHRAHTCMSVQ